jgi:hypothetical protein
METCARLQDELDITGAEESVDARGVDHDENKCRSRWDEMGGRMWSVDHLDGGRGRRQLDICSVRTTRDNRRAWPKGGASQAKAHDGGKCNKYCLHPGGGEGGEVSGETRRVRYL